MDPVRSTAGSSRLRALLPLLLCGIVILSVLALQFHRTQANRACLTFEFVIEGEQTPYRATLNGIPYASGLPSGIGSKSLRVEAPNAEPFETNLFIWYSGVSLGTINLSRSMGTLSVDVAPSPNIVTIQGERFRKVITDCGQQSLTLATGDYELESRFEHFSTEKKVHIFRNSTATAVIKPEIVAFELASEPPLSDFSLESFRPQGVAIQGHTPATISSLPTGEYQLTIWQKDYRKVVPLTLKADLTNRLTVKFDYANVVFKSKPDGATIQSGESHLGLTPTEASFPPGHYRLTLAKSGYASTNIDLTISTTEGREISVVLSSVAFLEAMERAHAALSGFSIDYDGALQAVEMALNIQPGDPAALQLQAVIQLRRQLSLARQLAGNKNYDEALKIIEAVLALNSSEPEALSLKGEITKAKTALDDANRQQRQKEAAERAEARKKRPSIVFNQTCGRQVYNELFPDQSMQFSGAAGDARDAVLRMLRTKPQWKILTNVKTEPDIYSIFASVERAGGKQVLILVCGQTTDESTEIHFKLWEFIVGDTLGEWKPLHPKFTSEDRASLVQRYYAQDLQSFRSKLAAEIH